MTTATQALTPDIESAAAAVVHARATYGMTAETGEAIRLLGVALGAEKPCDDQPAAVGALEAVGRLRITHWPTGPEFGFELVEAALRSVPVGSHALCLRDAAQAQIVDLQKRLTIAEGARDMLDQMDDEGQAQIAALTAKVAELERGAGKFETRADGVRVRRDRWEWGIRRIVALLWGNRHEFEVDDVVEAVRKLVPEPVEGGDAEGLVRSVAALGAARHDSGGAR